MKLFSNYQIHDVYMTNSRYGWANEIFDELKLSKENITITAPNDSGRTTLAARLAIEAYQSEGDDTKDVLYYSPKETALDKFSKIASPSFQNIEKNRDVHLYADCTMSTVMVPTSPKSLNNILASGLRFSTIIIDDTDFTLNKDIENVLLKATIDDAKLILIGDNLDTNLNSTDLTKRVWKWLQNHPSFKAYRVIEPNHIKHEVDITETALAFIGKTAKIVNDSLVKNHNYGGFATC